LGGRHLRPWTAIEGLSCRFHRSVNIFAITFGNLSQNLTGGGVVGGERFPGSRFHPFAVDEHLSRFANKLLYPTVHLHCAHCGSHHGPPHGRVRLGASPALSDSWFDERIGPIL